VHSERLKTIVPDWNDGNNLTQQAMTIRPQKLDNGAPQNRRVADVSLVEPGMIAADAHHDGIPSTVAPNRRLRNWILLVNVLVWAVIVVVVRWLFF
jgi:hypothetical protein